MEAEDIPATLDGLATFNTENALAAVAIAIANGVAPGVIRRALSTFRPEFEHNPGRLNVVDMHGFRVIFDYAHNPAGLAAVGDLLNKLRPAHRRVIGSISMAGDRRDQDMREMGRLAATMLDEVVFWEDDDRRGRPPGEIMTRLREGALAAGMLVDQMRCLAPETRAAAAVLSHARPGDLVLLTATQVDAMWDLIRTFERESEWHGDGADAATLVPVDAHRLELA
jgi:cyanophycin synthetase